MEIEITADDVGKHVVYGDETLGQLVEFDDESPLVEPRPSLSETIRARFGLTQASEDAFPLRGELVGEITEREIVLVAAP